MTEKFKLLSKQGIGKRYHKMSLAEYPNPMAKEVIAWIEKEEYKEGRGFLFAGDKGCEHYDLSILAARALVLSGYTKLWVMNLQTALAPEVQIELSHIPYTPIVITNYIPSEKSVDQQQYARLEALLHNYLDNNVFVGIHSPDCGEASVFTNTLVSRFVQINKGFFNTEE